MTTVQTSISAHNLRLITIFFDANELTSMGITLHTCEMPYKIKDIVVGTKAIIAYTYDENNDEHVGKLIHLALAHSGIDNMLCDYLNKCGISNYGIH